MLIVSGPEGDEQGKHSMILNKTPLNVCFIANPDVLLIFCLKQCTAVNVFFLTNKSRFPFIMNLCSI